MGRAEWLPQAPSGHQRPSTMCPTPALEELLGKMHPWNEVMVPRQHTLLKAHVTPSEPKMCPERQLPWGRR